VVPQLLAPYDHFVDLKGGTTAITNIKQEYPNLLYLYYIAWYLVDHAAAAMPPPAVGILLVHLHPVSSSRDLSQRHELLSFHTKFRASGTGFLHRIILISVVDCLCFTHSSSAFPPSMEFYPVSFAERIVVFFSDA